MPTPALHIFVELRSVTSIDAIEPSLYLTQQRPGLFSSGLRLKRGGAILKATNLHQPTYPFLPYDFAKRDMKYHISWRFLENYVTCTEFQQ